MTKRKKTGFTLIELMVVIVIIGILAVLGLVSFQNALRRARNTKSMGDVKDLAAAQEQYKALQSSYVVVSSSCSGTVGGYSMPAAPSGGSYACQATTTAFCISALLVGEPGNCGGCSSATAMDTSATTHFCVLSKQ